jgi:hypothetical protein
MWASCIRLINPIDGRTVQVGGTSEPSSLVLTCFCIIILYFCSFFVPFLDSTVVDPDPQYCFENESSACFKKWTYMWQNLVFKEDNGHFRSVFGNIKTVVYFIRNPHESDQCWAS